MVYDSSLKRAILFGGYTGQGSSAVDLNDTWEWKGNRWTQIADSGPSPRSYHSMVYDSARNKIVLFGGQYMANNTLNSLGDTWEFDGSNWAQIENTGPRPRFGCEMVYDSYKQRTILFGGLVPVLGDTWEWRGEKWVDISGITVRGPAPRGHHSMVFDPINHIVTLFGGFGGSAIDRLGDTWIMKDDTWSRRQDIGPSPRAYSKMVYADNRTVLFGGDGPALCDDTWEWNGNLWIERQNMGPTHRREHSMAYDSERQRIILFGGLGWTQGGGGEYEYLGDTWELKIQKTAD
jgi:hypothetical protein